MILRGDNIGERSILRENYIEIEDWMRKKRYKGKNYIGKG